MIKNYVTKPFKFKERVIILKGFDGPLKMFRKNRTARVWRKDNYKMVAIRFDENINGHDLGNEGPRCTNGHGWYVERRFIRRLGEKKG